MNKEEFDKYVSDGYTQIPVYDEFVADLISPLYVFSNYFNLKNTDKRFEEFIEYDGSSSRYIYFYLDYLIEQNKINKIPFQSPTGSGIGQIDF